MGYNRNICFIVLCVGLLMASSSLSVASSDHAESLAMQNACGPSGVACSNKAFEEKQIARFPDKVQRRNGQLKLQCTSNAPLILRNNTVSEEQRNVYWFITLYQQTGYFLVQVRGWEGFHYLMISTATGTMFPVNGVPIISQDSKRFVVTSLDLEAGYRPNRIAIFRFTDEGITQEWSKEYTDVGPSDAVWINNTVISYIENASQDGGQTRMKKQVKVQLTNDEWNIVTTDAILKHH